MSMRAWMGSIQRVVQSCGAASLGLHDDAHRASQEGTSWSTSFLELLNLSSLSKTYAYQVLGYLAQSQLGCNPAARGKSSGHPITSPATRMFKRGACPYCFSLTRSCCQPIIVIEWLQFEFIIPHPPGFPGFVLGASIVGSLGCDHGISE